MTRTKAKAKSDTANGFWYRRNVACNVDDVGETTSLESLSSASMNFFDKLEIEVEFCRTIEAAIWLDKC